MGSFSAPTPAASVVYGTPRAKLEFDQLGRVRYTPTADSPTPWLFGNLVTSGQKVGFATAQDGLVAMRHRWSTIPVTDVGAVEMLGMQAYYNPPGASTMPVECIDSTAVSEGPNHTGNIQPITAAIAKTGTSTNTAAASFTAWPGYAITAGTITTLYGFRSLGGQLVGGGTVTNMYGFYAEQITRTAGTAGAAVFVMPSGGGTNIGLLLAKGSAKPTMWIQDNASAFVLVQAADSTTTWTWTLPPNDGGVGDQLTVAAGNGVSTWAAAASSEVYKDILGTLEPSVALERIRTTPIKRWRYKADAARSTGDKETEYESITAETAPWAMHFKGQVFNPLSAFGNVAAAVQALAQKVEALEARVA